MIASGDAVLVQNRSGEGFGVVMSVDARSGSALVRFQSGAHHDVPLGFAEAGVQHLLAVAEEVPCT